MKGNVCITTLCLFAMATADTIILTSDDVQRLDNPYLGSRHILEQISDGVNWALEQVGEVVLPDMTREYSLGPTTGVVGLQNNVVTGFDTMVLDEANVEIQDTVTSGSYVTVVMRVPVTFAALTVLSDYMVGMDMLTLTGGVETTYYDSTSIMNVTASYNVLTPTTYNFCIRSADIAASSVSTRFTGQQYTDYIVNRLTEILYQYMAAPMLATISSIFGGLLSAAFSQGC